MSTSASTDHLKARISTDLHSMLKRAIEQAEVNLLSPADQKCFAQALLSPPLPSPSLERAFARRNKLLRSE